MFNLQKYITTKAKRVNYYNFFIFPCPIGRGSLWLSPADGCRADTTNAQFGCVCWSPVVDTIRYNLIYIIYLASGMVRIWTMFVWDGLGGAGKHGRSLWCCFLLAWRSSSPDAVFSMLSCNHHVYKRIFFNISKSKDVISKGPSTALAFTEVINGMSIMTDDKIRPTAQKLNPKFVNLPFYFFFAVAVPLIRHQMPLMHSRPCRPCSFDRLHGLHHKKQHINPLKSKKKTTKKPSKI